MEFTMRFMTYKGYLYTDRFFIKAVQNRRLKARQDMYVGYVKHDGPLIELNRVCTIIDPHHQADRYVGFLPVKDQLPETLQRLDVTDLVIVDYEYFKLVINSIGCYEQALEYYLNIMTGCVMIKQQSQLLAGIMPIESVRLEALMYSKDGEENVY